MNKQGTYIRGLGKCTANIQVRCIDDKQRKNIPTKVSSPGGNVAAPQWLGVIPTVWGRCSLSQSPRGTESGPPSSNLSQLSLMTLNNWSNRYFFGLSRMLRNFPLVISLAREKRETRLVYLRSNPGRRSTLNKMDEHRFNTKTWL